MNAYVRKFYNNHYYLISGLPENHVNNDIIEEFSTRRQAIRFAKKNGYDLIIQNRDSTPVKEAAAQ